MRISRLRCVLLWHFPFACFVMDPRCGTRSAPRTPPIRPPGAGRRFGAQSERICDTGTG